MLGSLTAGFGLAAPFMIYGAALLVAAAVVFVSLRHSVAGGAGRSETEPTVSVRTVLRHRAYRAALFSNFATGWAAFGLRIALVPLFVVEALGSRRRASPGWRWRRSRSATYPRCHPQRLSVGPGRAPQAADRRADGVGGRDGAGRLHVVAAGVPGRRRMWPARRPASSVSPQQAAVADIVGNKARGGHRGRDVPDDGRPGLDRRIAGGRPGRRSTRSFGWAFVVSGGILLVAAIGWVFAPETRGRPPAEHDTGPRDSARRPAAKCRDQLILNAYSQVV